MRSRRQKRREECRAEEAIGDSKAKTAEDEIGKLIQKMKKERWITVLVCWSVEQAVRSWEHSKLKPGWQTDKAAKDATDMTEGLNPLLFCIPLQANHSLENDTNYRAPH